MTVIAASAPISRGDVKAKVEMRPWEDGAHGTLRVWAVYWNFGVGELLVGQDYAPTYAACDETVQGGSYGSFGGSSRAPMIQLKFASDLYTLKIAAVKPEQEDTPLVTAAAFTAAQVEYDYGIPKLEASVDFSFGPMAFKIFGGYNTFSEAVKATDKEYDVDAWALGLKASYKTGPFSFAANIWTSENTVWTGEKAYKATYVAATDSIEDSETTGWHIAGIYKINDTFSLKAGYGQEKNEVDIPGQLSNEDERSGWYINMPITLAKNFWVIPFYSQDDQKDKVTNGVTAEEGDSTYWGARWQIYF